MEKTQLEKEIQSIYEYVFKNKDRLVKQFDDNYISLQYRDIRGAIVVDSDNNLDNLMNRLDKYGKTYLMIGTVKDILAKYRLRSPKSEFTQ